MANYSKVFSIPGEAASEIFKQISKDIENLLSQASLKNCEVKRDGSSFVISIKHNFFSAQITCEDSALGFDAKLTFAALPFRSMLDSSIKSWISKNFHK